LFIQSQHSINKGVGCYSCHGQVDAMPLMYEENTLQMEWCLNCQIANRRSSASEGPVFNMQYQQPSAEHTVHLREPYTSQV